MKVLKYISIVMVLIIGVTQCKLPDNIDPKNPTGVPIETLFTNAETALINQVDANSVNLNTHHLTIQYWQEMQYFDESRYLYQDRKIPDGYTREFYRDALMDLKRVKELLADWGGAEVERDNKIAIASILEVYAWQCVIDAFGDMPYSQALQLDENSRPEYDDAAGVYTSIMSELGIAIGMLKDGASFGGADVMFGGDIPSWRAFAYSLQMRLGMRLADVDNAKAKAAVEGAEGKTFAEGQGAILHYSGITPHTNAIYTAYMVDGRQDFTPANTIIDLMNGLDDPRRALWFTKLDGEYVGAVAGLDGAQTYTNFSHFSAPFFDPSFQAILHDYVEVEFLLAEAVERGYGVSGSAEEHYNNAINASILFWGGTQADADTYLAQENVAYATAAGTWKEKIGTQKYLGLYNRAVEAWAEWRRLDFPILNVPEGMVYGDIPKRYPYPFDEKLMNEESYNAAVTKMGGTDDHRQPIFWDVN